MKKSYSIFFALVLTVQLVKAQNPVVSSLSATVGYIGSNVVITGSNFNTTAANNIVYFGATRASVSSASGTSLSVAVPTGATYMPVSVYNTASLLTGYSQYPYLPTYDNSNHVPNTVNFGDKVDFATATSPQGMAIGDLDRDGKTDLVVANFGSGTISVFRNTSTSGAITSGSFAAKVDFSTGGAASSPFCVAIGDVNGDGKPDIVVANQGTATVSVFRNTSSSGSITSGSFAARVDYSTGINSNPQSIAIGDIDGDGRPDLTVANFTAASISVFRNTYSSTAISFAARVDFATDVQPGSVAVGDLDGDGMVDVAVVNFVSGTLSVFRNTSTVGSISASSLAARVNFVTGSNPRNVAIGDLNNDGKPDISVVNYSSNTISVFCNNSTSGSITSGSFNAKVDFATGNTPRTVAIADFDGDGKPDLAATCQNSNVVSVFLNTVASGPINSGSFAARVNFITGTAPVGLAAGDLDGDGKADLAVCNQTSGTVSVFRNNPIYPIVGTNNICRGATTTLTDATSGGTWVSGIPAIATVGSASGIVTGIAGGTASISYVLGVGRMATFTITVNTLPAIYTVTGGGTYCGLSSAGLAVGLTGSQTGIMYQLYNNGVATGSPVAGTNAALELGIQAAAGVYTVLATNITTSCSSNMSGSVTVSIDSFPNAGAITGAPIVFVATAITLSDTANGGIWSASNTNASVTAGVVMGVTPGTVTISYSVTNTCGTAVATKLVTVNMYDPIIAGPHSVCEESTITLTNASPGTWSSGDTALATVGAVSGEVIGKAAGTVAITYSFDACAGCYMVLNITVKALPPGINGDSVICVGGTTILTSITGTSWISSNPSVATIGITSGLVTGIAAGTSIVTFLAVDGCVRTTAVVVNVLPGTITGTAVLCPGATTSLANAVAGGIWSSSNNSVASVNSAGIVSGVLPGTATISYTLGTGCATTARVTVNPLPAAISGPATICTGSDIAFFNATAGGTWGSSDPAVATVSPAGVVSGIAVGTSVISYTRSTGCTRTLSITVAPPLPGITGATAACVGTTTTLSNSVSGGTWSSSNTAKAMVNPTTGVVTGMSAGTATIIYTLGACAAVVEATINALPSAIAGAPNVCTGLSTTFSNTVSGGTWTSSNTAMATVDTFSGLITGVAGGATVITYTLPEGCLKTRSITINNPAPAITGNTSICQAMTSVLSCATAGVSWTSSDPSVATISLTSGVLSGVSAGTATITYLATTGCRSTVVATVLPLPTAISGVPNICRYTTTALSSIGTTGGTWASSNTSRATVNAASGIVTGMNTGTATITYTWVNGCKRAVAVTVNPLPIAGVIVGAGVVLTGSSVTLTPSAAGGTWSSANPAVATITPATGSTATLSGVTAGNVMITYTNTNSCGAASVRRIFSVVTPRPGLQMEAGASNVAILVYPNPTSGTFTIAAQVTGTLTVCTIDGRIVQQYSIKEATTKVSLPATLTAGIYLCRFTGDDGSNTVVRLVHE